MNIFVLDEDPNIAASMQCDKHVVKMILESAQMLCSVYPEGVAPYKKAFYNHPCTRWVRESSENWSWLVCHAKGLCAEYTRRYEKIHKSEKVITWCASEPVVVKGELTPFAQAMPDHYKVSGDAVQAYRNYYIGDKARFAKWKESSLVPEWFSVGVLESELVSDVPVI